MPLAAYMGALIAFATFQYCLDSRDPLERGEEFYILGGFVVGSAELEEGRDGVEFVFAFENC